MPRSFWIFVLGVLLLAVADLIWEVIGRYRRRQIERFMLAQGAVQHEDGSFTFSEGGFQFRRRLVPTGVCVGDVKEPIYCAINEVDIAGIRPVAGTIRISRRSEFWQEISRINVGSTRFVDILEPVPGYIACVSDREDIAGTGRLVNAFRALLDSKLAKSWWRVLPIILIDISPSIGGCNMGFLALDSLAAINKRSSVYKLNQIALLGCRTLLSEFSPE